MVLVSCYLSKMKELQKKHHFTEYVTQRICNVMIYLQKEHDRLCITGIPAKKDVDIIKANNTH